MVGDDDNVDVDFDVDVDVNDNDDEDDDDGDKERDPLLLEADWSVTRSRTTSFSRPLCQFLGSHLFT